MVGSSREAEIALSRCRSQTLVMRSITKQYGEKIRERKDLKLLKVLLQRPANPHRLLTHQTLSSLGPSLSRSEVWVVSEAAAT